MSFFRRKILSQTATIYAKIRRPYDYDDLDELDKDDIDRIIMHQIEKYLARHGAKVVRANRVRGGGEELKIQKLYGKTESFGDLDPLLKSIFPAHTWNIKKTRYGKVRTLAQVTFKEHLDW